MSGWSLEEKNRLFALVIVQMQANGAKYSLPALESEMPGRTSKAMSHILSKLKAEVGKPATPNSTNKAACTPKSAKSVSKGKKRVASSGVEDDDDDDPIKTSPSKKPKSVKKEKLEIKDEDMTFIA